MFTECVRFSTDGQTSLRESVSKIPLLKSRIDGMRLKFSSETKND